MPYELQFAPEAIADLAKLDREVANRILVKLSWYAEHVEEVPLEALTGLLRGLFRLRVGPYRVIYGLDREKRAVLIRGIGHRRDIYE